MTASAPAEGRVPFPPRPLDTFGGQLDDLLIRVCESVQLTPTQSGALADRYGTLCGWLAAEDGPFARFAPSFYAQGSQAVGTTVRGGLGFDLDFVLQAQVPVEGAGSPLWWLDTLEARLRSHGTYAGMVERKNRVVRVNYADGVHVDIIPAVHDPASGPGCVRVPDRELRRWKESNPKGFALWFLLRAARAAQRGLTIDSVEPLPAPENVAFKPRLKLAVQLAKRARDVAFQAAADLDADLSTPSVILTRLAGDVYTHADHPADAFGQMAAGLAALAGAPNRIRVFNPTNPAEEFTERWAEKPEGERAFRRWAVRLHRDWVALQDLRGTRLADALKAMFGEPVVGAAYDGQARAVQDRRSGLSVAASGLVTVGSAGPRVRRNTFFGS